MATKPSQFQALMALSASQTKESQSAVQSALMQRQRTAELKRKQQEEQERKERDLEKALRMKHFEAEKRKQEDQKREEERKKAREAELQRREDEQRDALRYGPKKAKAASSSGGGSGAPKWPSSSSSSSSSTKPRDNTQRRKFPEDDDEDSAPEFLTREEKRKLKQDMETRKLFQPKKRAAQSGYIKAGRRLPGGAVDITKSSTTPDVSSSYQSVKERIAAMPNTLTKLNTVKRDTRTIDEILQDRAKAKAKVLDGDEAREFSDWFGTSKKKEAPKKTPARMSPSDPASGTSTPSGGNSISATSSFKKATVNPRTSVLKSTPAKSVTSAVATPKSATSRSASAEKSAPYPASSGRQSKPIAAHGSNGTTNGKYPASKKRARSMSRSESPPPKRRATSPELDDGLGETIWKLFGRERNNYVAMDVLSDEEDMEADADILEREEMRSARIAKREEMEAIEEERRHEEEKRKRRKERETRERR